MSNAEDKWDAGERDYKAARDMPPQSWKLEVTGEPRGKWTSNAVRLPTREDAIEYKFDLFCRWTGMGEARVAPSDDPPNYQWVNGRITPMKPGDVP